MTYRDFEGIPLSRPSVTAFHPKSLQATTPRNRLTRELEDLQETIAGSLLSHELDLASFQNPDEDQILLIDQY